MQTEVLRVLRAEAWSWWRHRKLRRTGDLDAALRVERQTILRDLGYLRAAINNPNAYVSCGGGGTILHLGLTTVSLYARAERVVSVSLAPCAAVRQKRNFQTRGRCPEGLRLSDREIGSRQGRGHRSGSLRGLGLSQAAALKE
ncbi:MAG: hypothetical protein ABJL67_23995 [Sulfitobacter sp.]